MKFVKLNKQINIPQTPSLSFVSFFFFFCVDWSRLVVTERLLALAFPVWRKLLPWIVASKIIWTSQAKWSWIVIKQDGKTHLSWPKGRLLKISIDQPTTQPVLLRRDTSARTTRCCFLENRPWISDREYPQEVMSMLPGIFGKKTPWNFGGNDGSHP